MLYLLLLRAPHSNPDSFNRWSASLGLDTSPPNGYRFADIWGLDPDLLQFVKQPVKAVLMLFPVTPEYEAMRKEQDQQVLEHGVKGVEDVIYFKQTSRVALPLRLLSFCTPGLTDPECAPSRSRQRVRNLCLAARPRQYRRPAQ